MARFDMTICGLLMKILLVYCLVRKVDTLDYQGAPSLIGNNCSSLLHIPIHDSSRETDVKKCDNCSNDCPPWYQPSGHGTCQFGDNLGFYVKAITYLMQSELEKFYCMTTTMKGSERIDVVGGCLFSALAAVENMHYPLPCNISELNDFMCADLNREGQHCGKCRE